MKKYIIICSTIALALFSCQPKDVDVNTLFKSQADVQAILDAEPEGYILYDQDHGGLNQFVADYMTEEGDYQPVRTRSTYGKYQMFSIDSIPVGGKGIYIMGRITTDDWGGNFYKALVIQQMVGSTQHALRLSVDAGNASGLYAKGQLLLIRVNGLAIGKYANQPQLCVPTFNNNTQAQHAEEKVGWAPGRIPAAQFAKATTLVGQPQPGQLFYENLFIRDFIDILDCEQAREWDGKLVRIGNIHFTNQYANANGTLATCTNGDPTTDGNANVFGPTTGNVGYPQGRVISDGQLNTIVSTSEYAKYAHMYLPDAEYVGTVEGILGFYEDNGRYAPTWKTWSISLRDLSDLKLVNAQGKVWEPTEYHK